jgi:hypothetical protein
MQYTTEEGFAELLYRLDSLLGDHEPEFAASLNAPATDADIEELQAAVGPYEVPRELEMIFRWHNGQWTSSWPLLNSGPLLDTKSAAKHRRSLERASEAPFQWTGSWLPITHEGWAQTVIELDEPLRGLVIDAGFPDPPSVQAHDLTCVIQALCILIEADIPLFVGDTTPADPHAIRRRNAKLTPTRLIPFLGWRFPGEREDK